MSTFQFERYIINDIYDSTLHLH